VRVRERGPGGTNSVKCGITWRIILITVWQIRDPPPKASTHRRPDLGANVRLDTQYVWILDNGLVLHYFLLQFTKFALNFLMKTACSRRSWVRTSPRSKVFRRFLFSALFFVT
jgi:hypothetical protein